MTATNLIRIIVIYNLDEELRFMVFQMGGRL